MEKVYKVKTRFVFEGFFKVKAESNNRSARTQSKVRTSRVTRIHEEPIRMNQCQARIS
jgi:16S rRNA C1402 (ribose-2'-O) methylase RsmI